LSSEWKPSLDSAEVAKANGILELFAMCDEQTKEEEGKAQQDIHRVKKQKKRVI
jgi:hypothetical protein